MTVRQLTPPEGLLQALERARLHYASAEALLYQFCTGSNRFAGVFGDPDNASYEWFIWDNGKLTHSDVGYGCTTTALFEVLKMEEEAFS